MSTHTATTFTNTMLLTNAMSFDSLVHILIFILHIASVFILFIGVAKALFHFFASGITALLKHNELNAITENNRIKQQLASYILLSLEILIAADIIESILNPTMDDILILGTIVLIRTIMSYFLEKEITTKKA